MDTDELLERAGSLKAEGNALFGSGEYKAAISRYTKV